MPNPTLCTFMVMPRFCNCTTGDSRNETMIVDIFSSSLDMLLRTPAGAVGAVGAVRSVSDESGDARIHAFRRATPAFLLAPAVTVSSRHCTFWGRLILFSVRAC